MNKAVVTLPRNGKVKLTPRAHRLLERALTNIVRMPETFDMGYFMRHDDTVPRGKLPKYYYGTTACLAGHIVLAAGFPPQGHSLGPHAKTQHARQAIVDVYTIADVAANLISDGDPEIDIHGMFYRTHIKSPRRLIQAVTRWLMTGK